MKKMEEDGTVKAYKQINFFKRFKRAIFNVETYGEFVLEKLSKSTKYFFTLLLIISLILAGVSTYNFNTLVNKAYNYVKNEMPDFSYEGGEVKFSNNAEAYDKDVDFYTIINTDSEVSDEVKEGLKEKVKDYEYALIFLKDTIAIVEAGNYSEHKYTDIERETGLSVSSKTDLINKFDMIGIAGVDITYYISAVISLYIANIITYILDVLMIAIFGYIVARIVGLQLQFSKVFALSIYSLTLPVVLSTIYTIVYSLTGFYIKYFDITYLIISYIYIIAAILIIKSDIIKQKMELEKIIKVEKEVKKELEEKKEEDKKKEKKEKKNKKDKKDKEEEGEEDPILNREPDGSEI